MSVLNIGEKVLVDNSIVSNQIHTHQPYTSRFDNNDEIRIPIQEDLSTLPSMSYLYLEGTVPPNYTFDINGIPHLFSEIRYEMNGVVIDSAIKPGIVSTMKGYCSLTDHDIKRLRNAGWVDGAGSNFNVCIPLSTLLGFAEDYRKVIVNIRQELILIRSNSDTDALVRTSETAAADPKVTIDKIFWKVPHITPGLAQELALTKYIDKSVDTQVAFRSWRLHVIPGVHQVTQHSHSIATSTKLQTPRYIIVGFQQDRSGKTASKMSQFDHCKLKELHAYLNTEKFPYDNLNIDFIKGNYATLYEMYSRFQSSYYNKQDEPLFDNAKYKASAPLVVIDCSSQRDHLPANAVTLRLEFETSENIPENTIAYCLVLHDCVFTYNPLTKAVKQI